MTALPRLRFNGKVLLLGCGSVSQCLQPLLLRHLDMDFTNLTVMDFEDLAGAIPETLAAGAIYARTRITQENISDELSAHLSEGDLLINLAWNIDTVEIIQWCQDHGVLYVDTSVELWDPYEDQLTTTPQDRTLYARHMKLRERAKTWKADGPTAVVEHGANPGLVSHWTKVALEDITAAILRQTSPAPERREALQSALANRDYAKLGQLTGTKVIHISERDTQISDKPKQVGEFVNTWSVEGFYEEGIAPAEMGWGTHEPALPEHAYTHADGPRNQICLAQTGITTYVRSWVPIGGPIIGMVVRHGEAFTISDHLTVWEDGEAVHRPTVHYAYLPTDAAMSSLYECRMNGYELQTNQRIMNDEITDGMDELGVLLLVTSSTDGGSVPSSTFMNRVPWYRIRMRQPSRSPHRCWARSSGSSTTRTRACAFPTISTTPPFSRSPTLTWARFPRSKRTGTRAHRPTSPSPTSAPQRETTKSPGRSATSGCLKQPCFKQLRAIPTPR